MTSGTQISVEQFSDHDSIDHDEEDKSVDEYMSESHRVDNRLGRFLIPFE